MNTLIASSPTVEGIQRMINRFWVTTNYRVDPDTLTITNVSGRSVPSGATVDLRKGRYRFSIIREVNA